MLGQKKNQASGNTVRNNYACSFSFKADAQVTAENNQNVTAEIFNRRLSEMAGVIDSKFGHMHPVAQRARVEWVHGN
jgi:hypothetical protein